MASICTTCQFRSFAVKTLNEDQMDILGEHSTAVQFKKGDIIFKQDAFSTNIGYLKTGLAKLHMTGLHGREQIIQIAKAPTYLGIPTCLGNKVNQYSATALEVSSLCFIDREIFKKLIMSNPRFSYEIIKDMAGSELNHFRSCFNKTQKHAKGLVADALLNFANNIYDSRKFTLPLTRSEIADLINSSRELVSKVLSEFHHEQIIELKGREVKIVNLDLLMKISEYG